MSTLSEPNRIIRGRGWCLRPGCLDEDGSRLVQPPDQPGQLTRADRRWLRQHAALARELAEVERRLLREVNG